MEFVDGLQADDPRLPAGGIEDRIVVGHSRRVRHGGRRSFFGFTHLIDQDRLAGFCCRRREPAAVGHILQIDADDFGCVVLKIIDQVRFIHVAFVANADNLIDADQIIIK